MNCNKPKVSVIIPVYNTEKYVGECIESVLAQTMPDFELILVDDGSPDRAGAICDEYAALDTRIRVIHKPNGGVSSARNAGIVESSGDYLYFVDSDDKIFPKSLENIMDLAIKYPNVDIVQGNYELKNLEKSNFSFLHFSSEDYPEFSNNADWIQRTMLKPNWHCVTANNKLVERNLIVENNLFFHEGLIHEDELWRWQLHKYVKSIAFCTESTYWYRIDNNNSIMSSKDKTNSIISCILIGERIGMNATSHDEVVFACYFLSPYLKFNNKRHQYDKQKVRKQIQETYMRLKNSNAPKLLLRQFLFMKLPIWLMNNIVFHKLYYEYRKFHKLAE